MKWNARCLFIGCITILLALELGISLEAQAKISTRERKALIALYNITDGNNWACNDGWLKAPLHTDGFAMPGSECDWYGITCNAENTGVEQINLSGNNLKGIIPNGLSSLSHLKNLHLADNQLTGSIPLDLTKSSRLKELYLEYNLISGCIPAEIAKLSNLKYLHMGANLISGRIPPELGNLANLRMLNLSSNLLDGEIPATLGNLGNLAHLYLHDNQLTGNIPAALANLSHLKIINLRDNQLSGNIPSQIINLTNLSDNLNDFRWNHLAILMPELRYFFKEKQIGGDLENYQIFEAPVHIGRINKKNFKGHAWGKSKTNAGVAEPM